MNGLRAGRLQKDMTMREVVRVSFAGRLAVLTVGFFHVSDRMVNLSLRRWRHQSRRERRSVGWRSNFFRFAPDAKTILELGSLEGAHTFMLAERPGIKRVLALEGRELNLRKARFVQELLKVPNVEFAQANLENSDLAAFGKFDAVFCSGLIYHLPEPWKLIAQLPAVAPRLFIWTHYAPDAEADIVIGGLRGKIHHEGGAEEPLSGMSSTATWLTLGSLISSLTNEWIWKRPRDPQRPHACERAGGDDRRHDQLVFSESDRAQC